MQITAAGDFHGIAPILPSGGIVVSTGDICNLSMLDAKSVNASVRDGKNVMKFVSAISRIVVSVPGNHDLPFPHRRKFLSERYSEMVSMKNIADIQHSAIKIGEYSFVGYGGTAFPEILGKEDTEVFEEWYEYYSSLMKGLENIIIISHNPPYNSGLDRVGKYSVGSMLVKALIKDFSPLLSISGHVHERRGRRKIGDTVAINHGPAMDGWYAVINLESRRVSFRKAETINFRHDNTI